MTDTTSTEAQGLLVVYAVKFTGITGEAALAELDGQVEAHCHAIDPGATITRGDLVPTRSNPYPSAGFLHGGEPRRANARAMPEKSTEDLALQRQAKALAEQLGGRSGMIFLDGHWEGSVHYTDNAHRHFFLRLTGGWT